jgi:hypothetical protein
MFVTEMQCIFFAVGTGYLNGTGAAQKRAIVRTDFFPGNIRSRLEECLRKGGHLEDVVFKKYWL